MSREEYINSKYDEYLYYWSNIAVGVGFFVILSLVPLDYFASPQNFRNFLLYRVVTSLCFVFLYFLNRKKINRTYQSTICIFAGTIVAVMIALMIAEFEGHQSIYFAGIILLMIYVFGLIPFTLQTSLIASSIIYITYLMPILSYDKVINKPFFISANIFILACTGSLLLLRYLSHKRLLNELGLQYDIAQQKEQLAKYSTQLENLVEERTRELNKSELMLRSLFENANDGIMIIDRDGIILDVNQKTCQIHGFDRDSLVGVNIGLLETEKNKELFEERKDRILNGESLLFETQHYRKDGSKVALEISSKAVDVEGKLLIQSFHRDITDKKRLQGQLFQSQKMESIGVLAGGIAHDFNNILSAILGHAELLHEFGNLDATAKQRVKIIENSSRKAGQMISKLLSFARQGNFESAPVNLNDVIRDTLELIERMITKKKILIKLDLDETIPSIIGDSNQIEQVIMNLAVNAADAMPSGGHLSITTHIVNLDKDAGLVHPLLSPGRYISMAVLDNGIGIPEDIRDRIFDPFFTTKGPGKGTGLGLAMVYGIVKEHKGVITVKTQPGKGTTFEIYLPASDKLTQRIGRPASYSLAGREKILVVDDDEDVLSFMRDILETQGYRVLATSNPVYALDIFRGICDEIDLVIADIVMPLVNGRELVRNFKMTKPAIKIIAVSAYDIWNTGKKERDINAYIRKPFESVYLLSIVRKVLDSSGSATFTGHQSL